MQNNSSNPSASQGAATSESNNLPISRPVSAFAKLKSCSRLKDIELMDKSILMGGETGKTAAIAMADMEQLAQNRGNAMLRYKEKKKTRRYVLSFPLARFGTRKVLRKENSENKWKEREF